MQGNITNNADVILSTKVRNIETVCKMLDTQGEIVRKMLKEGMDSDSKAIQNLQDNTMETRTYLRCAINALFINNFLVQLIKHIVNFYYELFTFIPEQLKISKNVPIKHNVNTKNDIVFLSITGDKMTVHD